MSEEHPAETEVDVKGVASDQPLHPAIFLQLDCFWVGKCGSNILGEEEKKGEKGRGTKRRHKPIFSSLHSLSDSIWLGFSEECISTLLIFEEYSG